MIEFFNVRKRKGLYGSKVCIVGPHPSVTNAIQFIDPDAFIIALNRAVLIPEIDPDVFICADPVCPTEEWFKDALQRKVSRLFSREVVIELPSNVQVDMMFFQQTNLKTNDVEPKKGELRYNGTVFAQALQACYWTGVREVEVAGVMLEGSEYFNGEIQEKQKRGHWSTYVNICNALIKYLTVVKGMHITSLCGPLGGYTGVGVNPATGMSQVRG